MRHRDYQQRASQAEADQELWRSPVSYGWQDPQTAVLAASLMARPKDRLHRAFLWTLNIRSKYHRFEMVYRLKRLSMEV